MLRKIRRIFLKSTAILLLSILVLLGVFLVGIQTFTFQTWLGQRVSSYMSTELGTQVSIQKIELEFFRKANLRNLLIIDKHRDTLVHGDLLVNMSRFSYSERTLRLDKITLHHLTAKIIEYKSDSSFNYQFLADYFSGSDTSTSTAAPWDIQFGDIVFDDVNAIYKREKYVTAPSHNINFDDVACTHLFGKVSNFKMDGDTIHAEIQGLRLQEKSGLVLKNLSTKARVSERFITCEDLKIETDKSKLAGQLEFTSNSWDDYLDFVNLVKMNGELEDSTRVNFSDISIFAPELNGVTEELQVSGRVKGTVSDLRLKNFTMKYGKYTGFKGQLQISGLPDINATYLHFDAKDLTANYSDLINLPNYPFSEGKKLVLPEALRPLGTVAYRGKFDGFLNDFTTYGTFKTAIGKIKTDLSIKIPEKEGQLSYHGKIITENFNLGTLLGQSDFNQLSMNAEISGEGVDPSTMEAEFKGVISQINYNKYTYSAINLNGSFSDELFNGVITSKDPNADFDFNGTINFKEKVPQMDFISTLNHLNLHALNFTTQQDSGVLSSQILINLKGSSIDDLSGFVNFDNTMYKTKTRTFKLSTFDIQAEQNTEEKKIRLSSEYLNATVFGRFEVDNIQPIVEGMLYNYYPSYFTKPLKNKTYNDDISIFLKIKKFNTIRDLFLPEYMLSPNTTLNGRLNAAENTFNLQFNSPLAKFGAFSSKDLVVILNQNQKTVLAEASGKSFQLTDSIALENFNLGLTSADTLSGYHLDWDNLKQPAVKGDIDGKISFNSQGYSITNEKLAITVKDSVWNQTKVGLIRILKNGDFFVDPISIASKEQSFSVGGALTKSPTDSLTITLHNLILQQFNGLLKSVNLKLEGIADGRITINNAGDLQAYNGFLKLDRLLVNSNTIGQLVVNTNYHPKEKYVDLNGYTSLGIIDEFGSPTKNISFNGRYDLEKKDESIDIDFTAKPANLSLLNPYLTDIITIKNAFVNGSGKIHGNADDIKIDGKFRLFNSEIKVDYTNVSYSITGEIEVMPDQIRFSDLLMREKGSKSAPQGTINGNVFHRNFTNWQIDYDISYNNMLLLNTTEKDNSLFYGRLYGTGMVGIYGFINKLHMEINTTTNKYSKFVLPLDGPAEIGESDYIHFVKKDTSQVQPIKTLNGFDLDMVVHATPDAQAQIIIDKTTGDMLNVQGQGDLTLRLNTLGKFEMFGDYFITDGDYLFTLENVINKKFDIESGSSISWSGDPMNAEINVTTSYRQRASVAPLLNDTTGAYKSRTPVDCKLIITDKLFSPNINFDIEFPNLDGTSKSRIASVLSDETELNRQVFSFLLFRTFATPLIYNTNGGGVTAGGAAANTGSELLSNRVSEFLNTYFGSLSGIKDLQLGLNYRPGSSNTNETVDLALSKQFLDNKISVDGNFGVNQNARNSNSLIGDVNVDYKLTNDGRFRLKGFNRSNDNTQITTAGGPYTQGVGFFYRVEFNSLNELWKSFKAKTRNNTESK